MKTRNKTLTTTAWLTLSLLSLALYAIPSDAQKIKPGTAGQGFNGPDIMLEVKQGGDVSNQWIRNWVEADPQVVKFRWSTKLKNIQSAQWQVLGPDQLAILARGNAGAVPAVNGHTQFNIDFRSIAGATKHRPLKYWVRVALFNQFGAVSSTSPPIIGAPVKISFVGSGPGTNFDFTGLRPDLLHTLPLAIDLQTLKILDGGNGQEPYLLAVIVYADGTTIKPKLVGKNIEFPNSSVRLDSPSQTHDNIAGASVDENQAVPIPASTGHFETILRPIGIDLAQQLNFDNSQQTLLRSKTVIGILVIGLEEGSTPSTDVMDEVRAELLGEIQAELDAIVRGVKIPVSNPSKAPSVLQAVDAVKGPIRERLVESAKAKGLAEFYSYLKIPGGPHLMGFLAIAALNHDEFVGAGTKVLSYQDLLDAGEAGVTFDLDLKNSDNDLRYRVRGRAKVR